MKRKHLIIMRNGLLVKRFVKVISVVLTESYDSVMWLKNNDKRAAKLIEQGYWLDSIVCYYE